MNNMLGFQLMGWSCSPFMGEALTDGGGEDLSWVIFSDRMVYQCNDGMCSNLDMGSPY